jgi:hypothetical protein
MLALSRGCFRVLDQAFCCRIIFRGPASRFRSSCVCSCFLFGRTSGRGGGIVPVFCILAFFYLSYRAHVAYFKKKIVCLSFPCHDEMAAMNECCWMQFSRHGMKWQRLALTNERTLDCAMLQTFALHSSKKWNWVPWNTFLH